MSGKQLAVSGFIFSACYLLLVARCLYAATISSDRIGYVDMDRILKEFPETGKIRGELLTEVARQKAYIAAKQKEIDEIEKETQTLEEEIAKIAADLSATLTADRSTAIPQESTSTVSTEKSTSTSVGFTFPSPDATSSSGISISTETPAAARNEEMRKTLEASRKEREEILIIKRELLSQKEKLLAEFKATSEKEITDLDTKAARNIYGRIYDVIKFVADASALTVVLDGANVIYGEKGEEITERVIQRLIKLQIQETR